MEVLVVDTAHYTAIPWAFGSRNLQGLHHSETLVSAFTTMTWIYNSYKKHIYNICNCVRSELKYKFKFKFKLFIGITSKVTSFTNVQETKNMKHEIGVHKGVMKQYIVSHTHTLTHTRHTCTLTTYCSYLLHFKYTQLLSTEYVYDDRTIPNHILQKLLMNALNTLCREDTSTVHSIPPLTQIILMHVWVASWARLAAPYDSDFTTWTLSMNKTVGMIMSWWVVDYSDVTMDSVTSQTTLGLIVC